MNVKFLCPIILFSLLNLLTINNGCAVQYSDNGSKSSTTFYWFETPDGKFDTNDLVRAQNSLPFQMVLLSYIPDVFKEPHTPEITGPLKKNQIDGKIEINIFYRLSSSSYILLDESNYPILPPDPSINPGWESIDFNGVNTITDEKLFDNPAFYFNVHDIYVKVKFEKVPLEEDYKVVASLINQAKVLNTDILLPSKTGQK